MIITLSIYYPNQLARVDGWALPCTIRIFWPDQKQNWLFLVCFCVSFLSGAVCNHVIHHIKTRPIAYAAFLYCLFALWFMENNAVAMYVLTTWVIIKKKKRCKYIVQHISIQILDSTNCLLNPNSNQTFRLCIQFPQNVEIKNIKLHPPLWTFVHSTIKFCCCSIQRYNC